VEQLEPVLEAALADPEDLNPLVAMDILKVFTSMCSLDLNAQAIVKLCAIPILRGMEVCKDGFFLQTCAHLMSNLAVHPGASHHLGKRGAPRVLKAALLDNLKSPGLLAKITRALANLALTDKASYRLIEDLELEEVINQLREAFPAHNLFLKSSRAFLNALRQMRQQAIDAKTALESMSYRDRLKPESMRTLLGGTIMRKFCRSSKPRRRRIRASEDCLWLFLEDTKGKKATKQLSLVQVTELRLGLCTPTLIKKKNKADPNKSFAIFFNTPTGDEDALSLEATGDRLPWVTAFQELLDLLDPNRLKKKRIEDMHGAVTGKLNLT